jgi:hypothetical protein
MVDQGKKKTKLADPDARMKLATACFLQRDTRDH